MFIRATAYLVIAVVLAGWFATAKPAMASSPPSAEEHAAHGEEAGGGINPLVFKKDLAVWTAVVFILLLLVLGKFAWGPIVQGLDKREQGIADQIADAEKNNKEAKQLLVNYEGKLAESANEVRQIIEQARRNAEQAGREIVEKARTEAGVEHQRALREIEMATSVALKELAEQSASLAVDLAGKIVGVTLEAKDYDELICQSVASFGQQKPSVN